MRILLLEVHSGISGDMFVAAAAHLAGCEKEVAGLPGKLGMAGVTCTFYDTVRGSIQCRKFEVKDDRHPHFHSQDHGHRSLSTIRGIIGAAGLEADVKERALRMFERLAAVEAVAHNIPIEKVHFHEVGAVDSIIDIVAASLCIERLNIETTFSTPVCVGFGTVDTGHGILPVPTPATEQLLRGMPVMTGVLDGEWTTPTGALILSELAPIFDIPTLATTASALGGGRRDPAKRPNVLRLRLAEPTLSAQDGLERDEVMVIRCNIDDSSGELLGADFAERLLQEGARDVVIQQVIMKKGRPGQVLEILVGPGRADDLAKFILANTSSIGVRMSRVQRITLPREACIVGTPFGAVEAKVVRLPDGSRRIKPEYESCRARARENNVSVQEVYRAALQGTGT